MLHILPASFIGIDAPDQFNSQFIFRASKNTKGGQQRRMPHYCKREVWTLASRVKGAAQVLFFFYIYCGFLIFGQASISGPLFTSFQEEPTFHSITALSYLFKHHSCPQDCQTQIMTRVDQNISRLNTSLKRRKICRSSEREKYVQNVFIILFVKIFTFIIA